MGSDPSDAIARANQRPEDVAAQIDAAYACDRLGDEAAAVRFYDAAWRLRLPADADHIGFMLGYGSTLKNVGRLSESVSILRQAIALEPSHRGLRLFLALTLERMGRSREALAEAIAVALTFTAAAPDIGQYSRALSEYVALLIQSQPEEES